MQRPVTIYIKQKNGQSLPRSEAIRMAKEKNIHYALPEDDEDED
jgi:hypothetical protein